MVNSINLGFFLYFLKFSLIFMNMQIRNFAQPQWLSIKLTLYGIYGIDQVQYRYIYICKALKTFSFCSLVSDKALWFSSIFMNMDYANFIFCILNAD